MTPSVGDVGHKVGHKVDHKSLSTATPAFADVRVNMYTTVSAHGVHECERCCLGGLEWPATQARVSRSTWAALRRRWRTHLAEVPGQCQSGAVAIPPWPCSPTVASWSHGSTRRRAGARVRRFRRAAGGRGTGQYARRVPQSARRCGRCDRRVHRCLERASRTQLRPVRPAVRRHGPAVGYPYASEHLHDRGQRVPALAVSPGGDFVVVWSDRCQMETPLGSSVSGSLRRARLSVASS
jgi:hypothetical protein